MNWNTYTYKCPTKRCASWKIKNKYWGIDSENKRASIPQLIWNDGHSEWSRVYWFKDSGEHIIYGYYVGFK